MKREGKSGTKIIKPAWLVYCI